MFYSRHLDFYSKSWRVWLVCSSPHVMQNSEEHYCSLLYIVHFFPVDFIFEISFFTQ